MSACFWCGVTVETDNAICDNCVVDCPADTVCGCLPYSTGHRCAENITGVWTDYVGKPITVCRCGCHTEIARLTLGER